MRRMPGPRALIAALVALAAFAFAGAGPVPLSAQSSGGAATIPADQAQEFLGQWSLGITGGQGEQVNLSIAIEDADGQVAAEVAAEGLAEAVAVNRISRSGESLVLSFMPVLQGQPIPVEIELAPDGEDLTAEVVAADGMFMASGTAVRE